MELGKIERYPFGANIAQCSSECVSLQTQTEMEIAKLNQEIEQKTELLELLKNNPDFDRIITLMRGY